MIKEIKKHWKEVLFLILGVPIIFISITYFLFDILPGNEIIEKNNWISFAGSYLGIMGAVGAVWWQMKKEENDEIKGLLCYIKDILEYNKENYTLDYMEKVNCQAASIKWSKNEDFQKIKLKDLDLNKADKLLLYKHSCRSLIKLDDKIKEIKNSYYFTSEEENIFFEVERFIKNNKDPDFLYLEPRKIFLIIQNISDFFYYLKGEENFSKKLAKKSIEKANYLIVNLDKRKFIEKKIISDNLNKEIFQGNLFQTIKSIADVKFKYLPYLYVLAKIIGEYNSNYMKILFDVQDKKTNFFLDDYQRLISEISEEYEKLEKILK